MANDQPSNRSDSLPAHSGNGALELGRIDEEECGGILRSYFVLLAFRHRRLLIAAALCSMVLVFVLTAFVMHPKYQATAIIRPLGQNSGGLGSLLQSTGLGSSTNFAGTGIDSDIGTNVHDPDELVTILNSYTFTTAMVQAENLGPRLTKGAHSIWSFLPLPHRYGPPPLWSYYLMMSSRFDCENSVRTGNITLTFMDKDPGFASYVLNQYINRLRNQLRAHDVAYDKAAAKSLEQEASAASDPMMRDDLYDLAARQIKKIKTAEANSDFAFNVLEQPYVPPYKVKPTVMLDTLLAGLAVPLLVLAILVARDWAPWVRRSWHRWRRNRSVFLITSPFPASLAEHRHLMTTARTRVESRLGNQHLLLAGSSCGTKSPNCFSRNHNQESQGGSAPRLAVVR